MKNITRKAFGRYPSAINIIRLAMSVVLAAVSVFAGHAYNMRRTTNSDGLSNSAILSLNRDDKGYLWIGTCDGVNIADGVSVSPFSEVFPGMTLSGNIIETIHNVGQGKNWILTNYGLDLVDTRRCTVRTFRNSTDRSSSVPTQRAISLCLVRTRACFCMTAAMMAILKRLHRCLICSMM